MTLLTYIHFTSTLFKRIQLLGVEQASDPTGCAWLQYLVCSLLLSCLFLDVFSFVLWNRFQGKVYRTTLTDAEREKQVLNMKSISSYRYVVYLESPQCCNNDE